MKGLRGSFAIIVVMLLFGRTAASHHGFAAVYDGTRSVSVSGVVTQFKFVNPHAMLFMDVTDASNKITKWTIEFDGRLNLSEGGWTADTIKAKERLTVTGNPTHEAGTQRMFFLKLTRADGKELLRPSDSRLNTIDEERRQRAAAREKK
jgi:hypothetical protein